MGKSFLYDELMCIYETIITNNEISEETYIEFSNFIQEWNKNINNLDNYTINYLLLNLINYIEILPECSPMLYILIKEIRFKIFKYTTENIPNIKNENFRFNTDNIDYTKIFYQTEDGGVIYQYYRPINGDFNLPPYGQTSILKISYISQNKKFFQDIRINHRGRVLELVGEPCEEIDFCNLNKNNENDYEEIYNNLLEEVLKFKNNNNEIK